MSVKVILSALNTKYIHSNLAVYDLKEYTFGHYNDKMKADIPDIRVREFTINHNLDHILQELYREKADVYAFSSYIWNISEVLSVAGELKKLLPDCNIWLGGPEVSYDSGKVLDNNKFIKGIIRGEGEVTFHELVSEWVGHCDGAAEYTDIKGITYRNKNGDIMSNPTRELLPADDIPFVYNDENISGVFKNKILYYETSRGCPFSCSYCLSSIDKSVRIKGLDIVKNELDFFIKNKVHQVKFVDRTFNCDRKHALDIWRYIAENDNGVTNYHFEVAADLIGDEEFKVFECMRPGLIQLEIGLQTTNPDTISEIRRSMNVERVSDVMLRFAGLGNIHTHLDLIAGLPYEDIESFRKSFDTAYGMRPSQLQLGFLKVLKGSYMEEMKGEYGLIYSDSQPYEVLKTRWIDYDGLLKLKLIEDMVEVYYNSRQFVNTLEYLMELSGSPFDFYEGLGRYYYENDLAGIGFRRESRYGALKDYVYRLFDNYSDDRNNSVDYGCGMDGENMPHFSKKIFDDLLIHDYYLRENAKNRPSWAKEQSVTKEEYNDFFRNGGNDSIRIDHEGYDSKLAARSMHIEAVTYETFVRLGGDLKDDNVEHAVSGIYMTAANKNMTEGYDQGRKICCLYDYDKREPVNNNAETVFFLL